ncbi:hypothetical protein Agabi119p4_10401 [Agaricus bisporus var. burnettii]|uniref:Uncharacterized protein n=1 Tax=Agaricus bisporus var. burnettii TaxID=192524 RepID=A0A8H7EWK8_AGABI|nr:hypothetical protein Agabi119p4_10401 [Agaricus bisporus var. burnettii]
MNVVGMLIESYAVECVWTIVFVILVHLVDPMQQFFGNTQPYIEIIAYLLVLYRVASGRAYGSQRAHEPQSRQGQISSLHWNHHTTTTQSGIASRIGMDIYPPEPQVGSKPETDILRVQDSPA